MFRSSVRRVAVLAACAGALVLSSCTGVIIPSIIPSPAPAQLACPPYQPDHCPHDARYDGHDFHELHQPQQALSRRSERWVVRQFASHRLPHGHGHAGGGDAVFLRAPQRAHLYRMGFHRMRAAGDGLGGQIADELGGDGLGFGLDSRGAREGDDDEGA